MNQRFRQFIVYIYFSFFLSVLVSGPTVIRNKTWLNCAHNFGSINQTQKNQG